LQVFLHIWACLGHFTSNNNTKNIIEILVIIVVFDTTYKVNSYEMPFGIFVGMNNHGKTVLFGCALLRNETTFAFCCLMKVIISYIIVYLISSFNYMKFFCIQ
jgi:hypothetical protein